MPPVAILIPVLARPDRVGPLLVSLWASVDDDANALQPIFLASPRDEEEIAAIQKTDAGLVIVPWEPTPGDYWRKINHGMREAAETGYEWIFQAADDLNFHAGWLAAALAMHDRSRACVIGTNDLANQRVLARKHSTHSLVRTEYLDCGTIDEPHGNLCFHEHYGHWFGDDEFVQTAIWRETFQSASDSVVEHMHPVWGKADVDSTYAKGRSTETEDQALYYARRYQWGKG